MTDKSKIIAARIDNAVSLHQELLQLPSINKAIFIPTSDTKSITNLEITSSTRSISQLNKSSSTQTLTISSSTNSIISSTRAIINSTDILHTSYSSNKGSYALFKSIKSDTGKKVLLIEIWDVASSQLKYELDVSKSHGDWYFDDSFGNPSWSSDGLALLYTAEAPLPTYSTLDSKKFSYTPDFGEKFTSKQFPTLFMLLLPGSPFSPSPLVAVSDTIPTIHQLTDSVKFPNVSFGQAIFLPSDSINSPKVLATGYSTLGDLKKLGIVYCTNRSNAIYELSLSLSPPESSVSKATTSSNPINTNTSEGEDNHNNKWSCESITLRSPENRSARSPRLLESSLLEPILIYLSNPMGGAHNSCATLHAVSLRKGQSVILVDTVLEPTISKSFPGLYLDQLPQDCFLILNDAKRIEPFVVLSSQWGSRKVPLLISLKSGSIRLLSADLVKNELDPILPYLNQKDGELGSLNVLGTDRKNKVVAIRSTSISPGELVITTVTLEETNSEWKVLQKPKLSNKLQQSLKELDFTILPLAKFNPSEIILISPIKIDPSAETKYDLPPLITIPHGGPHSAFSTEFSAATVALSLAGYRIALLNYPGSTGYGQNNIEILPPNLSTLDVDSTLAVPHYLNTISLASRTRGKKLLMGGSHGGFVSCFLTAKYENEFDAVVLRNPVTDLSSMLFATDIPDWTFAESALPYSFKSPPTSITPTQFNHLHQLSPLSLVENVKTPTLLLLGQNDRRVPNDQGRAWYHALKSRKEEVDCEMLLFPLNGHALDSTVECELVGFESGLRWLSKYTSFH